MPPQTALLRTLLLALLAGLTLMCMQGLPRAGALALFGVAVLPAICAALLLSSQLHDARQLQRLLTVLLWLTLPASAGSWLLLETAALWHLGTPAWYVMLAVLMFAAWTLPLLAGALAALRAGITDASADAQDTPPLLHHWQSVMIYLALLLATSLLLPMLQPTLPVASASVALPSWIWLLLRLLRPPALRH